MHTGMYVAQCTSPYRVRFGRCSVFRQMDIRRPTCRSHVAHVAMNQEKDLAASDPAPFQLTVIVTRHERLCACLLPSATLGILATDRSLIPLLAGWGNTTSKGERGGASSVTSWIGLGKNKELEIPAGCARNRVYPIAGCLGLT